MDPLSAFKSEVFRPVACLVLPGLLALAPFAVLLCNESPLVANFFDREKVIAFLALFGAATTFGMLLENVGVSIERGIDICMEREYLEGMGEVWDRYLASDATNTNGRRYLGTIVTRLKFINSLIPALSVFGIGLFLLLLQRNSLDAKEFGIAGVILFSTLLWLFRVSIELSEVASNTRQRILSSLGKNVLAYNPSGRTVGRERHFAYALAEVLTSRADELKLTGRRVWVVIPWLVQKTWKWITLWIVLFALIGATQTFMQWLM